MQLMTRPTTWAIPIASIWANILRHLDLEHVGRVEESSELSFEIGFRLWSYYSEVYGDGVFTGTVDFSDMTCLLWSRGDFTLVGFAQGFLVCEFHNGWIWVYWPRKVSPDRENLLHKKERALLLPQQIAPNRVSEKNIDWEFLLMSTHEKTCRFCFDGTKTSMECSPAQFVVFVPKTAHQFCILNAAKKCVLSALFFESLVRKYGLLSTSVDKTCLFWYFRNVLMFSLSRAWCPEAVRCFRCVKVGEVVCGEFWSLTITSFFVLLCFDCAGQTTDTHTLRRKCTTDCKSQFLWTTTVFVWVVLRKWMVCLLFLDLGSQEWFSTVK